jgi:hypothetical protein
MVSLLFETFKQHGGASFLFGREGGVRQVPATAELRLLAAAQPLTAASRRRDERDQFSEGLWTPSITRKSTLPFADSNFIPSCFFTASRIRASVPATLSTPSCEKTIS